MSRTLPLPRRGRLLIFDSYSACPSGRLSFELGSATCPARRGVHVRAVVEGLLRRGDVAGLAAPGLERRVLQRARVGERERPGQVLASPPWRSGARWPLRPTGRRRGTRCPAAPPARCASARARCARRLRRRRPGAGCPCPRRTMLVFRIRCSSCDVVARRARRSARAASPRCTSSERSAVWLPSSSTSGSIIGTIDAAWQAAA